MISLKKYNDCHYKFCEVIGDDQQRLLDNIIFQNHKAVLLLRVEDSDSDDIKMLLVSFNKIKSCITGILLFDCKNVEPIAYCVKAKLGSNYMNKVQDFCDKPCEYFFENNILYYAGEKGFYHEKIADFSVYALDKISGFFEAIEKQGIRMREIIIKGSEYMAVEKKFADKYFGDGRRSVYRSLSDCDLIYSRKENDKRRFSKIEKKKDKDGVLRCIEFFAVRLEAFQAWKKFRER